jgi:hypothetical protein
MCILTNSIFKSHAKESAMTMTTTPSQIRDLFLNPHPTYSPVEAAEAVGMSVEEVWGLEAVGELEGIETANGIVVPWTELVSFAMDFWDQAEVEAALGTELAEALPELLQLADLGVRIPRFEVVALERIAVRDGRSVDSVLARELRDLVSAQSVWLAKEIPGFSAALSWPE